VHEPNHVFVDASGNLYFTDANNLRIRKVDAATGNINTVAGNGTQILSGDGIPATSSGFNFIGGMTLDTASNIYISDFAYYRIRKVDSLLQNQPPVANAGPDRTRTSSAPPPPAPTSRSTAQIRPIRTSPR